MNAAAKQAARRKWQNWHERQEAVDKVLHHWLGGQEHARLKGLHAAVMVEVKTFMREKARRAVERGGDKPFITLRNDEFADLMRAFICQERRHRYGPVEHFSAEQLRAQLDGLCKAYGWEWVEAPVVRALPVKAEQGGGGDAGA